MKNISFKTAKNDIIAGIIVALVSIPISMGYAQIAGLPAAYGLYHDRFYMYIVGKGSDHQYDRSYTCTSGDVYDI